MTLNYLKPMFVQTVALKDVKFKAFHGFYQEEQLIGSHFSVDVVVTFTPNEDTENLNATVNYEDINLILRDAMQHTQKLLETVVKNIIDALISKYSYIQSATVGIKKMNPPMLGEIGYSFVQLSYKAT